MPADKRPSTGEDQMIYKTFLALAGALALVVLLLPGLIGFGVFYFFRAFLRRRDYILLLLGSVVVVFAASGAIPEYFRFITSLFGMHDKFFSLKLVVTVLALSAFALGVIGDLLAGQRVMTQRVFERVRRIELEAGVGPAHPVESRSDRTPV